MALPDFFNPRAMVQTQPMTRDQQQAAQLLDGIRAQRLARGSGRVNPAAQLRIMETIQTGVMPDGSPLNRAGVLALLSELGVIGRNLIPLRSANFAAAAVINFNVAGQFVPGMGVLGLGMTTGVAVGAVPVHTRVHRSTWSMDTTPMYDSQAQPFFPGPSFSSISFFRLERGGQTLTGTGAASFPAADVGSVDLYIYEDAEAAEELAKLLIGG